MDNTKFMVIQEDYIVKIDLNDFVTKNKIAHYQIFINFMYA